MSTSHITRQIRTANPVYRPVRIMIMAYENKEGKRIATQVKMVPESQDFIFRTLKWAAGEGITVTFLPL